MCVCRGRLPPPQSQPIDPTPLPCLIHHQSVLDPNHHHPIPSTHNQEKNRAKKEAKKAKKKEKEREAERGGRDRG